MTPAARAAQAGPALPSIRARLSRALLGVVLAGGLAVTGVIWAVVGHEVDELMDSTLQESTEVLFALLQTNADRLQVQADGTTPAQPHEEHVVWQVVDAHGRVRLRSHQSPVTALSAVARPGFSNVGLDWRVYGKLFAPDGAMLYAAQRGAERREAGVEVAQYSAGAALAVGLLCALWLRWRLRRELWPITQLSQAVSGYEPALSPAPLAPVTRSELLPMHAAITDLGHRLGQRLANERAFTAHAAHALRTPLAGLVAQLALAQKLAPAPLQAHLQRSREAARRLQQVVVALLALFRSGGEIKRQHVNLADLVAELPTGGLVLTVHAAAPLLADQDLLAAALLNLLDNAQRLGATHVALSCSADGAGMQLRVHDNGPGWQPGQRQRVQAALDQQAYEGQMGLGLTLADLVARAHGGRLQLLAVDQGCAVALGLGTGAGQGLGAGRAPAVAAARGSKPA